MKTTRRLVLGWVVILALGTILAAPAAAQSPQQFADDATRYMALGDSIAAGYKAMPVTEGYAYRLYLNGVFDRIPHTLFANISAPGATSLDVLKYQVPQALIPAALGGFNAKYITLTVGGDDLLTILAFALQNPDFNAIQAYAVGVIQAYAQNLAATLQALRQGLPNAKIFVANQYPLTELHAAIGLPNVIVPAFNQTVAQVVSQFPTNVYLVDVYSAFDGKTNLVEGERGNTPVSEVHPTNAGHRVIEKAFADVIAQYK